MQTMTSKPLFWEPALTKFVPNRARLMDALRRHLLLVHKHTMIPTSLPRSR